MYSIVNNPFRLLGLPANCTERELQKQRAKLSAYANINRKIETDYDFPNLPEIQRSNDLLNSAAVGLETPDNKLLNALFWFTSCGNYDELAFEYLKNRKIEKASEIWEKISDSDLISPRKLSAINNLSTLSILNTIADNGFSSVVFFWAVGSKLDLLETDYFQTFSELVLNRQEKLKPEDIVKRFLTLLVSDLEPHFTYNKNHLAPPIDISDVEDLCFTYSIEIDEHYRNLLASSPELKVEKTLEQIKNRLNATNDTGITLGEELYRRTFRELKALKTILGQDSIRCEMLADKVALELLNCGIDFFQSHKEDTNFDPSWRVMRLFKRAARIAVSKTSKDRIKENISGLQGWIDDRVENEKFIWLENEIKKLLDILEGFQQRTVSTRTALQLAEQSRPILRGIGGLLGYDDKEYLKMSCAVVRQAVGMVAKSLEQSEILYLTSSGRNLRETVSEAIKLHKMLETFDMDSETRIWFKKNDAELSKINDFVILAESTKEKRFNEVKKENNVKKTPKRVEYFSRFEKETPSFASDLGNFIVEHPFVTGGGALFVILISLNIFGVFDAPKNSKNSANSNIANSSRSNYRSNSFTNISNATPSNSPIKPIKTTRLQNGQSISTPDKRGGYGVLLVENGTSRDAIAKLVDVSSGKTYRQVYIRNNSSFRISGIRQGTFELKFSLGDGYSPELQNFTYNTAYEKFDERLNYTTTRTSNGIQ